MLAYGVVFVLLIGEIDLSIGFVSGVAGVVVAELQLPDSGHEIPDIARIPAGVLAIAVAIRACAAIGLFQGSIVALIGVPAFVVTLAGLSIWQGVIQKALPEQVIVIQDNTVNNVAGYFFSDTVGLDRSRSPASASTRQSSSPVSSRADGTAWPSAIRLLVVAEAGRRRRARVRSGRDLQPRPRRPVRAAARRSSCSCSSRSSPSARRSAATSTRSAATPRRRRRAGINVARVRMIVFMISSVMAGLGGVVLASRLQSVNVAAGQRHAPDRRHLGRGDRRHEPLRRPRRGAKRPVRLDGHRDDRQRAQHAEPHRGRDLRSPPA